MERYQLGWGLLLLLAAAPIVLAQASPAVGESFFAEKVYPLFERSQCNLCHSDNGVASATRLQFPREHANGEEVTAFGLRLIGLVDREDPAESLLLLKPTNRLEHTGGTRIAPGSDDEQALQTWIDYLASLTDEQVRSAQERVERASHLDRNALTMRRLTHSQYNNTVRDLVGDLSRPADSFPNEDFVHGFKNQREGQGIPPLMAEAYSAAAERLARNAFQGGDHGGLIPCKPASTLDAACAGQFVRSFGLKAFRRPLTEEEVRVYRELLLQEGGRTGEYLGGAQMVVEAMLQSPSFLFRIESGPGSPFEPYEIASRLSYFLWDTMPSEDLFDAAKRGHFSSVEQIEATARRMLEDPRAKTSLEEFLSQWLRFDRALLAIRERRKFREFSSELTAAMTEETRQLFNHLVWENQDFRQFFTADYTFVSSALARLYGLPEPAEEFDRVVYPSDSGRAGILGHGSFLTLTSKPADTSPTARGVFVREHFLCHHVPPPPAGVNTVLPVVTEEKPLTNRMRLSIHLNSQACLGCHRLIDPIGLGFEQYDAIGRYREQHVHTFRRQREDDADSRRPRTFEIKLDLDTTAHVQGIQNSEFSTPKELGRILAEDSGCQKCIVKQLFRYALGREESAADQRAIEALLDEFRSSGFRFQELIVSMATSKPFLGGGS